MRVSSRESKAVVAVSAEWVEEGLGDRTRAISLESDAIADISAMAALVGETAEVTKGQSENQTSTDTARLKETGRPATNRCGRSYPYDCY